MVAASIEKQQRQQEEAAAAGAAAAAPPPSAPPPLSRWVLSVPPSSPLLLLGSPRASGAEEQAKGGGEGGGAAAATATEQALLREQYSTLLKVAWASILSGGVAGAAAPLELEVAAAPSREGRAPGGGLELRLAPPAAAAAAAAENGSGEPEDPAGPPSPSWALTDPVAMVRSVWLLNRREGGGGGDGASAPPPPPPPPPPSGRSAHDSLTQDDWSERERSLARAVASGQIAAALERLAGGLADGAGAGAASSAPGSSAPRTHLCDGFGPADVGLLSTLSVLVDGWRPGDGDGAGGIEPIVQEPSLPPSLRAYRAAHARGVRGARELAAALLEGLRDKNKKTEKSASLSSPSLLKVLHGIFRDALFRARPELAEGGGGGPPGGGGPALPAYFVSVPKSGDRDYQCSLAMPAAAVLQLRSGSKHPLAKDVAEELLGEVRRGGAGVVRDAKVVAPGFVCFNVSREYLEGWINASLLANQRLDVPDLSGRTVVVDFSSPNIAKEMHVGHLRSTIIGEAVCRILEACGADVRRVNHVGDWGTQFGMLIAYLQETRAQRDSSGTGSSSSKDHSITDLTAFYKAAKERFDQDPAFKAASQRNVVKLQAGDPACREIWQDLCDTSRAEFEKVYRRLDVTLTEVGESFYNDKIPAVLDEFDRAGLLELDQSARVVRIEGHQVPLMLQKSDGGYGYDSTDMAALRYRLFDLKADRVIVITDFSQEGHFQMVYKAGHKIGWVAKGQRLQHIGFGTVMGEDGKRFKTRSGDTVRLVDLLDEAVSRMEAQLRERIAANKANITLDEVHEVAEAIGYGALKYFDLRRNPKSNYKFSYDEMLDTKGDTAVYLLYARVRLESILTKAQNEHGVSVQDLLEGANEPIALGHEAERRLALALAKFPDAMEEALDDLYPSHICEYVYRVANAATDFVTQCKVLGSPEMRSRLLLCQVTTVAIHQCFDLLGIRHVKRI